MSDEEIKSPCRRMCAVDGRLGFCRGCGRTLKEISNWSRFTHQERDEIIGELSARFTENGLTAPA